MNLKAMCLVQGPCAGARINASKLSVIMVTLKSFPPLNVNIHYPGSTNLARIQSWHEAGSCRSQEPGSYLCCHGNKRDWQSFLGSL